MPPSPAGGGGGHLLTGAGPHSAFRNPQSAFRIPHSADTRLLSVLSDMTPDEMDARELFRARPDGGNSLTEAHACGQPSVSEMEVKLDVRPAAKRPSCPEVMLTA
eukprot:CAMPEP_0181257664 /NCGR_PEP_ID=MMETSP1096-20121128/50367_1 /TAXON_ID=156174 ORGANISM="Chrysochromulina ericina, Strain CCMP281" /NCGR_SAMPLE_ID=MMETSP1096 /ASSEMBLY_ACC=CAM_ASM_000453 /LENGTH=104 /DNA_ID=CAMNT_0023356001 /DNA_START=162 /DNA_END=476 /DNA_ORIENTATION=+